MKANQKFRQGDDAVSPVIAVILMVAITVVLAATVYVWVSGFGSQSSQPAKTISLSSGAALATAQNLDGTDADDTYKLYTVSSAASGMRYGDVSVTVNGATAAITAGNCDATLTDLLPSANAIRWRACSGAFSSTSSTRATTDVITAGDHIYVMQEGASLAGSTLRIVDSQANSVILTLVVG